MFSVCFSYGSQLAKVEEQNTNIYIGDQVNDADSTVKDYWIGMVTGIWFQIVCSGWPVRKLETVVFIMTITQEFV